MCRIFKVSRSGFYKFLKNKSTKNNLKNLKLNVAIKVIWEKSRKIYGSPKITAQLRKDGWKISRKKVVKRMQTMEIRSIAKKKYRFVKKSYKTNNKPALNYLNRNFKVNNPNKKWVSDISYIKIKNSWNYLAIILDLYSRKVVGWAFSRNPDTNLVIKALNKAILKRKIDKNLLFHSDQGIQYSSNKFREFLKKYGIIQSMSRKGNCWDNAPAESFFSIIKSELIKNKKFNCKKEAFRDIFEYIEVFYNQFRLHSNLDYMSPNEFELAFSK